MEAVLAKECEPLELMGHLPPQLRKEIHKIEATPGVRLGIQEEPARLSLWVAQVADLGWAHDLTSGRMQCIVAFLAMSQQDRESARSRAWGFCGRRDCSGQLAPH